VKWVLIPGATSVREQDHAEVTPFSGTALERLLLNVLERYSSDVHLAGVGARVHAPIDGRLSVLYARIGARGVRQIGIPRLEPGIPANRVGRCLASEQSGGDKNQSGSTRTHSCC
jgi:hypothetical protein